MVDPLAHDLQRSFPDMTGLSPRNLKYMRAFAAAWPDVRIVQRTVARLAWRKSPIGVAEWETKLVQRLTADLKASLPTIREIATELASEESLTSSDNEGA